MADFNPPKRRDDEYVNPSYATDPIDVNRSFTTDRASSELRRGSDIDNRMRNEFPHHQTDDAENSGKHHGASNAVDPDSVTVTVNRSRVNTDFHNVRPQDRSARYDDDSDDDGRSDVMNLSRLDVLNSSALDTSYRGLSADHLTIDSLDSVLAHVPGPTQGRYNEGYDGDEETATDHSFHNNSFRVTDDEGPPVITREPDPAQGVRPDRPLSGRYHKNPAIERKRPPSFITQGPYDPNNRIFLSPLPAKTTEPAAEPQKKLRIPRPPSKLKIKCAYFWSCFACLIGNFLCAIPALRYTVTANESRKIGDYNSAHSNLKKTAILVVVGIALAIGAWTVVILYLTGSLKT